MGGRSWLTDLGRSISAEIERLTDDIAQGRSDDLHFAIARSNDVKVWWKGAPVNPYPLLAQ